MPVAPDGRARNGNSRGLPVFMLALLIGAGAHLAGLVLFHLEVPSATPAHAPAAFVHFTKAADAGQAQAMDQADAIWDPQMVYSPTPLNYASRAVAAAPTPAPHVFNADAGNIQLNLTEGDFHLLASSGNKAVAPSESLKSTRWDFMAGLGQTVNANPPPPARGAQLRVTPRQAGTDTQVMEVTWPASMAPKVGDVRWQPASFLLVFNETGLAGDPLLVNSSGTPAVDDDLRAKLRQWYNRHRLPAGYYSVEVAP